MQAAHAPGHGPARLLDVAGLALRNLPDVDVQSYAGAIVHRDPRHRHATAGPACRCGGPAVVMARGEAIECNAQQRPICWPQRVSLGSRRHPQARVRVVPAYSLHRRVWLEPAMHSWVGPELCPQAPQPSSITCSFTGYAAGHCARHRHQHRAMPHAADEDVLLRDLRRLRDWLGTSPRCGARWRLGHRSRSEGRSQEPRLAPAGHPAADALQRNRVPRTRKKWALLRQRK